ncbi:MAG: DUF2336 domain-containing protein [Alphaproteobacteria bacterium]|nr:DUF2336 domain-containing protein [Alphaproteobacteria bacterium]
MLNGLLRRLAGRRLPAKLSYEEARDRLDEQSTAIRSELAGRQDVNPEILYYIAEAEEPGVRRLVAANPATPRQADRLLVDDLDEEVRCALARKIARLVPDLSQESSQKIQDLTIEILEALAADQLPRVRAIIAQEIKDCGSVPKAIVLKLARDIEAMVAAPVLQYSPLLSDEDLREIIASGCVTDALRFISMRTSVSEPVADAIVASLDIPAVAALLANPNAQIREETLDRIIENAAEIESWHEPLVMRPDLSLRALRRIATFVAVSLLDTLAERHDLGTEVMDEIRARVRSRIEGEPAAAEEADVKAQARAAVEAALAGGTLDDARVLEAAEAGDGAFVREAISQLAGVTLDIVERIMISRVPKAVTALVWAAGLSMRTAVKVQSFIARIPPADILHAKHGTEYPLSYEELSWHLECFGIIVSRRGAGR